MKALGRLGGRGRRGANPDRVPASLREELRKLDPAIVRGAIEQTLAGGNESARVSAVKLLADVDAFSKTGDECPRCAAMKAEGPAARAKVDQMISMMVEYAVKDELGVSHKGRSAGGDSQARTLVRVAVRRALEGHKQDLQTAVDGAVGRVIDAIANGLKAPGDVSTEEAERLFASLEEQGLLVRRSSVEEMAEKRAQELLTALRQEHGPA